MLRLKTTKRRPLVGRLTCPRVGLTLPNNRGDDTAAMRFALIDGLAVPSIGGRLGELTLADAARMVGCTPDQLARYWRAVAYIARGRKGVDHA